MNTNESQRVLTTADGSFTVSGLAPGTYRVEVESSGFKRSSVQSIELRAGAPATISIPMEAGPATESVEIKARAPMTQSDTSEQSMALNSREVSEIPVVDRNHQELHWLTPGVTPPVTFYGAATDPAQNRFYSVNGQNPLTNQHYLDGAVNLEPFRGTAVRVTPSDAVQQMNVHKSNYPPELGFAGGSITNIVTHGGTNAWHGSLFEFHSNDEMNARKWFSPFATGGLFNDNLFGNENRTDTSNLVYNQFGGTVGGPLWKDKTFFFGSYEGTYQRDHTPAWTTVPTAKMRAGNFSNIAGLSLMNPATGRPFTDNVIPQNMINPFSRAIAANFPQPNLPGFFNNYAAPRYLRRDGNRFDGRLDHRFSDRFSGFLRYGYSNWGVVDDSILGNVIGNGSTTRLLAHNAVGNLAFNATPNLMGEVRLGFNRYQERMSGRNFTPGFSAGLPVNQIPTIQIFGMQTLGPQFNPGSPMAWDNTYSGATTWSWRRGNHNFSLGAEMRNLHANGWSDLPFGPLGGAMFGPATTLGTGGLPLAAGAFPNAFASFLLGAPTQLGALSPAGLPTINQWMYAGFAGDKITLGDVGPLRRLTLDLGVRYDVFSPLTPDHPGGAMVLDPNTLTFSFLGESARDSRQNWDLNNFAPRVGFAAGISDRTVIRGGYSIHYFQVPYRNAAYMPAQFGAVLGVPGTARALPVTFGPNAFPSTTVPANFGTALAAGNLPGITTAEDLKDPYVQQFHFEVQQEMGASTLFTIGYAGSLGRQLPFLNPLNIAQAGQPLPFATRGRTAQIFSYEPGLNNNYNALQVSASRRFAQGLSFQAAYTWSKALDYDSNFGMLLNPFDRRFNYGPADYDRKHVLTISHLWEIPVGRWNSGLAAKILGAWQINGVFSWSDGSPFSILADPLGCCAGVPFVTANAAVSNPQIANDPGPNRNILTASQFSQPSGGFGSLGRNAMRGPDFKNYDLSLFKTFPIREQYKLELRGSAFNLTNTPRFANPINILNSPDFGQVFQTLPGVEGGLNASGGRVITVGARFLF